MSMNNQIEIVTGDKKDIVALLDQSADGYRKYVELSSGIVSPWLKNGNELRSWLADKTWGHMRTITVIRESDHKSRYSTNKVQLDYGDKVIVVWWSDSTLKIEQLRDRLISLGANSILIDEFRELVSTESYFDGIDAAQGD